VPILLNEKVMIMPNPKPIPIKLTDAERQGLKKLVKRHNVGQQIALRGRIVLAADEGKNNTHIANEQGTTLSTVRLWRQRWVDLQAISLGDLSVEERLQDLPRPGAPARITADQVCQITALACEEPEESERPISHWTGREIADEIIERGIVDRISPRHAARLLKRGRSQTASDPLLVDPGS
jgi:putative transposase